MSKPKVILADPDLSYIFPLQQKFILEFYRKIELEVITDLTYFKEFFSTPQEATALIVSEKFFSSNIRRHNIHSVFVLCDSDIDSFQNESNVYRIFKYSSVNEVYNTVVGKTQGTLKSIEAEQRKPLVITVYSPIGGAGKTTVALGISACLSNRFKRVLYLKAENLQTTHPHLADKSLVPDTEIDSVRLLNVDHAFQSIRETIRNEGFSYLPAFRHALMSYGLHYSIFKNIAIGARESKEYDVIVIDSETSFEEDKISLFDISDTVLVITKNSHSSSETMRAFFSNIDTSKKEKYIVICNDYDRDICKLQTVDANDNAISYDLTIRHLDHCDEMSAHDLAREKDIQRVTNLFL